MSMQSPHLPAHIHSPEDLITSHEAIREGFLRQALAKTEKAAPYVEEALLFWNALQNVEHVEKLLELSQFHDSLIAAAGFSDKARNHVSNAELDSAVQSVLQTIASQSGPAFREELFARYVLTKGDALGGQIRNWTGAAAQQQLTAALLAALVPREVQVQHAKNSEKIQRIAWERRLILFDVKPRMLDKNIDLILLESPDAQIPAPELLATPHYYLACGELKGGTDPAGADEHWKTARSALERIRSNSAFGQQPPKLLFVGAAIADAMAQELFAQLQDGRLSYAANLTAPEQVADLAQWLVAL